MIDDELQRAWLEAVVTDLAVPFVVGPRIPEFGRGDILGIVTPSPGAGLVLEGINDVVGFQIRIVGRERDYARLKTSAVQIDKALLFADFPAAMWGGWVTVITRAGGGPSPELGDGNDRDRVAFVCTYLAETDL